MKLDGFACDGCRAVISSGYMIEGRLWRMAAKPTTLVLGDRQIPQSHFCSSCFVSRCIGVEKKDTVESIDITLDEALREAL